MKQRLFRVKDHFVTHERQYVYTALAIQATVVVLLRIGLADHNRFLREHDLYDEYYTLVD